MTESSLDTAPTDNWQDLGNCLGVDPELFFPGRGASTKEAKAVCAGCVVKVDCLEFALENGEKFGIWGGASERERRRIRRQRRLDRQAASAGSGTPVSFPNADEEAEQDDADLDRTADGTLF